MKDNLPEINIKGRKEKKGGILGWLRGFGSSSGSGAHAAIEVAASSSAGSAGSAGIGAFIAGHMSTVLVVAAVAVGGGAYVIGNAPKPAATVHGSLSSGKVAAEAPEAEYVPAILRSQAANQGSSLAMFTDKNKGSGLSLDEESAKAKKAAADKAAKAAGASAAAGSPDDLAAAGAADAQAESDAAAGGLLAGAGAGSLSTSLGGGSGKLSGGKMGGGMSQKLAMSNNVGAGFKAMPQFQERKGKLLSMRSGSKAVMSNSNNKTSKFSSNTTGAMRNLRFTATRQGSYSGTNADLAAATQNSAWVGETGQGGLEEGTGTGDMIQSASVIDNLKGNVGGSGELGTYNANEYKIDRTKCPGKCDPAYTIECIKGCSDDYNEEQTKCASDALMWIGISIGLSLVGGQLIKWGKKMKESSATWVATIGLIVEIIGYVVAACAALAAVYAAVLAVTLMTKHKQGLMGAVYTIGAVLAAGAAADVLAGGKVSKAMSVKSDWFVKSAGIITMIGSLFGGIGGK
ncbi:MAG TPA: hypothetical protein PKI19_03780 [Elusimicrobiales bacterium]|nr:hypothetical protein [Elusimicrobiales bacterium]